MPYINEYRMCAMFHIRPDQMITEYRFTAPGRAQNEFIPVSTDPLLYRLIRDINL